MFCPKCGKEMGEGLRFCGVCGFDTASVQQAVSGQAAGAAAQVETVAQSGTVTQTGTVSQTETAAQMRDAGSTENMAQASWQTETLSEEQKAKLQAAYNEAESKLVKTEKRSNTMALIGKIILVVSELYFLTQALKNAGSFIGVIVVAIFALVPFYLYVYVVRGWIGRDKRKTVAEYANALSGKSKQQLADMWKTSACPDIKDVNYNPYQDIVTIHSKLGGEAQLKKDGENTTLTWLKGKDDGYAQSTLAAYLAKQINPSLQMDSRKVYRNNKFWKHVEWICGVLVFGSFLIAVVMMLAGAFGGQQYISVVRDSEPDGYNITFGKAFDKVFDKGEWKYFETDDEMKIVDYTGTKNGRKIQLQWKMTPKDGNLVEYELYAAEIDGEPVSKLEAGLLLLAIMEGTSLEDELSGYGSLFESNRAVESDKTSGGNSGVQNSGNSDTAGTKSSEVQNESLQQSMAQNDNSQVSGYEDSYGSYDMAYEDLEGEWSNLGSCSIYMEKTRDISYHVTVLWGSSAWETEVWEMDAEYLPDAGDLWYENAIHETEIYDDNGNASYDVQYIEGCGYFFLSDGVLKWTSLEDVDQVVEMEFFRW